MAYIRELQDSPQQIASNLMTREPIYETMEQVIQRQALEKQKHEQYLLEKAAAREAAAAERSEFNVEDARNPLLWATKYGTGMLLDSIANMSPEQHGQMAAEMFYNPMALGTWGAKQTLGAGFEGIKNMIKQHGPEVVAAMQKRGLLPRTPTAMKFADDPPINVGARSAKGQAAAAADEAAQRAADDALGAAAADDAAFAAAGGDDAAYFGARGVDDAYFAEADEAAAAAADDLLGAMAAEDITEASLRSQYSTLAEAKAATGEKSNSWAGLANKLNAKKKAEEAAAAATQSPGPGAGPGAGATLAADDAIKAEFDRLRATEEYANSMVYTDETLMEIAKRNVTGKATPGTPGADKFNASKGAAKSNEVIPPGGTAAAASDDAFDAILAQSKDPAATMKWLESQTDEQLTAAINAAEAGSPQRKLIVEYLKRKAAGPKSVLNGAEGSFVLPHDPKNPITFRIETKTAQKWRGPGGELTEDEIIEVGRLLMADAKSGSKLQVWNQKGPDATFRNAAERVAYLEHQFKAGSTIEGAAATTIDDALKIVRKKQPAAPGTAKLATTGAEAKQKLASIQAKGDQQVLEYGKILGLDDEAIQLGRNNWAKQLDPKVGEAALKEELEALGYSNIAHKGKMRGKTQPLTWSTTARERYVARVQAELDRYYKSLTASNGDEAVIAAAKETLRGNLSKIRATTIKDMAAARAKYLVKQGWVPKTGASAADDVAAAAAKGAAPAAGAATAEAAASKPLGFWKTAGLAGGAGAAALGAIALNESKYTPADPVLGGDDPLSKPLPKSLPTPSDPERPTVSAKRTATRQEQTMTAQEHRDKVYTEHILGGAHLDDMHIKITPSSAAEEKRIAALYKKAFYTGGLVTYHPTIPNKYIVVDPKTWKRVQWGPSAAAKASKDARRRRNEANILANPEKYRKAFERKARREMNAEYKKALKRGDRMTAAMIYHNTDDPRHPLVMLAMGAFASPTTVKGARSRRGGIGSVTTGGVDRKAFLEYQKEYEESFKKDRTYGEFTPAERRIFDSSSSGSNFKSRFAELATYAKDAQTEQDKLFWASKIEELREQAAPFDEQLAGLNLKKKRPGNQISKFMPDAAKLLPENRASGTGSPSLLGSRGEERRREFSERFGRFHPDIAGEFDRGVYGIGYGEGESPAAATPEGEEARKPGEVTDPLTGKRVGITDSPGNLFDRIGSLSKQTPEVAVEDLETIAGELETRESLREQLLRDLRGNDTTLIDKLMKALGSPIKHPTRPGEAVKLSDLPAVRRQIQRILEAMGLDVSEKVDMSEEGFWSNVANAFSAPIREFQHGTPEPYKIDPENVSKEEEDRRAREWQEKQKELPYPGWGRLLFPRQGM